MQLDQSIRLRERQRPQHQAADDAEDRGGNADADRQHRHRRNGERAVADEQRARGVTEILREIVEPAPAPDVARIFAKLQRVAEARGGPHHVAVRFHLAPQIGLDAAAID
jgi:hypothetical protein